MKRSSEQEVAPPHDIPESDKLVEEAISELTLALRKEAARHAEYIFIDSMSQIKRTLEQRRIELERVKQEVGESTIDVGKHDELRRKQRSYDNLILTSKVREELAEQTRKINERRYFDKYFPKRAAEIRRQIKAQVEGQKQADAVRLKFLSSNANSAWSKVYNAEVQTKSGPYLRKQVGNLAEQEGEPSEDDEADIKLKIRKNKIADGI